MPKLSPIPAAEQAYDLYLDETHPEDTVPDLGVLQSLIVNLLKVHKDWYGDFEIDLYEMCKKAAEQFLQESVI